MSDQSHLPVVDSLQQQQQQQMSNSDGLAGNKKKSAFASSSSGSGKKIGEIERRRVREREEKIIELNRKKNYRIY